MCRTVKVLISLPTGQTIGLTIETALAQEGTNMIFLSKVRL